MGGSRCRRNHPGVELLTRLDLDVGVAHDRPVRRGDHAVLDGLTERAPRGEQHLLGRAFVEVVVDHGLHLVDEAVVGFDVDRRRES
jgi:hypothetical protein